jgi:oligoribonuclease NrnB/cAMP/cGMP phosphodiesterase (DHH superfamily)
MKCFYHSADLDGHCSGEIVRREIPGIEMIGIDYGDDFPWDTIDPDEKIIMVDFSLQPFSDMIRLKKSCEQLTWIDHHKSAMEEHGKSGQHIFGVRDKELAACEICWEYFRNDETPLFIRLLGRYDIWDLEWSTDVLKFQFGLRLEDTFPGSEIWDELFKSDGFEGIVRDIIRDGETVLKYQSQLSAKICKANSFETELDGLKCIASNTPLCNSQHFASVWDAKKYDAMLSFYYKSGRFWTVSLYSDKPDVDVSVICKARGGGGHKGAAGFQCDQLPF